MLDDKDRWLTRWVPHPIPTYDQVKNKLGVLVYEAEFIEHSSYVITDSDGLKALAYHLGGRLHILALDSQVITTLLFKTPVERDFAIKAANLLEALGRYYDPEWIKEEFGGYTDPPLSQEEIAKEILGLCDWSVLGYEEI